jgi:hypothetical protein
MRPSFTVQAVAIAVVLTCALVQVHATSNYTYKKDEYPVIQGGYAPNKLLSVASHGNGEDGYDDFHLYLMAEPAHTKISQLPAIGPDDVLDTGPDAYEARWSPDSQHVAVVFRSDRHIGTLRLYQIRDGRPQLIRGPDLLREVIKNAAISSKGYDLRSRGLELSWLGPTRFKLEDSRTFRVSSPALARILGSFGRESTVQDAEGTKRFVDFSVEAVCELVPGGKYRVVEPKPGRFD